MVAAGVDGNMTIASRCVGGVDLTAGWGLRAENGSSCPCHLLYRESRRSQGLRDMGRVEASVRAILSRLDMPVFGRVAVKKPVRQERASQNWAKICLAVSRFLGLATGKTSLLPHSHARIVDVQRA